MAPHRGLGQIGLISVLRAAAISTCLAVISRDRARLALEERALPAISSLPAL
jgi:hypothetical protein